MAQSFLLGENFVNKIRSTIDRVDGTPLPGAGGTKRPAILEDNQQQGGSKAFRIATFDGSWNKGSDKTVTFTSGGTTVTATNLFADVNSDGNNGVNCGIAKDGGTWYLIASEC
jgi:hypothetical protein